MACLAQLVVGNKHLFCQTELSFGNIAIPAAADGIGVVIGNGFPFFVRVEAEHSLRVALQGLFAERHRPVGRRGSFRLVVDRLYEAKEGEVSSGFEFSGEVLRRALRNIYSKNFRPMTDIEINLFNEICDRINEAARKGFDESGAVDPDDDFRTAILRNNEVFVAFKVHRMQNDMARLLLDSNGNLKPFEQWRKEVMPIASHQVGQWLRTEYNTAVLRAHQAADWRQFEREKDVLPNLRWMPSTSVNPGKDHMVFWGTVRPIDDPFWNEHRPGDRWNCKCDLSSTDDPVTEIPDFTRKDNPHPGLDNNPGKDGIIFSDSHPYFPKDCKYCSFYQPKLSDSLLRVFTGRRKNCYACKFINQGIEQSLKKDRRRRNWAEYNRLKRDDQSNGVFFDKKSGGLKATHVGHITHDSPKDFSKGLPPRIWKGSVKTSWCPWGTRHYSATSQK